MEPGSPPARPVLGAGRQRLGADRPVSPQRVATREVAITASTSNIERGSEPVTEVQLPGRLYNSDKGLSSSHSTLQASSSTPNIFRNNNAEAPDVSPLSFSASSKVSSNRSPRAALIGSRGGVLNNSNRDIGASNSADRIANQQPPTHQTALMSSTPPVVPLTAPPPTSPRTSNSMQQTVFPPTPLTASNNNVRLSNSNVSSPPSPRKMLVPQSPLPPLPQVLRSSKTMQSQDPATSPPSSPVSRTASPPLPAASPKAIPRTSSAPNVDVASPRKKASDDRSSVIFDSKEPGIGYTEEDGKRIVKLGLVEKLIEKLFDANADNAKYVEEFVITYPIFSDIATVVKSIIDHYSSPNADLAMKVHCLSTVLWLLVEHNFDMAREKETIQFLSDIVKKEPNNSPLANGANQIRVALARLRRGEDPFPIEVNNREEKIPKPIVPKNAGSIDDISPKEITRQITLISHEFYRRIKVSELLNQAWSKKDKEKRAPNLLSFIDRFNKTSLWVASLVINPDDVMRRAAIINHFVKVAKEMIAINNYDGMMAILTGLQNSSVTRLKQTWRLVTSGAKSDYEEMKTLMKFESNYKVYRETVMQLNPPAVPFIAPFLSDLTFVDENPKEIQGMINFGKCRLISRIISKVRQFQREPYLFEPVEMIEKYLKAISLPNEADLYKLSTKREEKGDETQAATALVNNLFS